jgi:hypothetical protein
MYIRNINISDFFAIYKWRNDPISISNSKSHNRISLYSHIKWFKKRLQPNGIFYGYIFIDSKKRKIGIVHFQKRFNQEFLISINLNPRFREKGNSNIILLKAIEKFRGEEKDAKIIAEILNKNLIAKKLFMKHNFKLIKSKNFNNFSTYVLK